MLTTRCGTRSVASVVEVFQLAEDVAARDVPRVISPSTHTEPQRLDEAADRLVEPGDRGRRLGVDSRGRTESGGGGSPGTARAGTSSSRSFRSRAARCAQSERRP